MSVKDGSFCNHLVRIFGTVSIVRLLLKCDATRAENRFRLSAKRTSPFKTSEASIQSTTGSRGVRISGSNAGYTMFRGSVKSTGYPLYSPVSPSLPLPYVTVCHHISTGLYVISGPRCRWGLPFWWVVERRILDGVYRRSGGNMPVHLQASSTLRFQAIFDCVALDNETDILCRNVGNTILTYVSQRPGRAKILFSRSFLNLCGICQLF